MRNEISSNDTISNNIFNNLTKENGSYPQFDSSIVGHYKILLVIESMFLIICISLFIYKLIKCYLLKREIKRLHEVKKTKIEVQTVNILMKKNNIILKM